MSTPAAYFDDMHRADDPWGYRERWYEARKRSLLLAMLPRAHFGRAWELGCANGELSAMLAARCETLLATDVSARAVDRAGERLRGFDHAHVERATHPDQWPEGAFDLIVFSEVGYYLDDDALRTCARRFADSLDSDGVLLACHWIRPFTPARMDGRMVHDVLADVLLMPAFMTYQDADIVVHGWAKQAMSVAEREGLA